MENAIFSLCFKFIGLCLWSHFIIIIFKQEEHVRRIRAASDERRHSPRLGARRRRRPRSRRGAPAHEKVNWNFTFHLLKMTDEAMKWPKDKISKTNLSETGAWR